MKRRLLFLLGALVSSGCAVASHDTGTLEQAGACEPGEVFECFCTSGAASTQVCNEAGDAVSTCACEGPGGGGTPAPGTAEAPAPGTGGIAPVGGAGGASSGGSVNGGAGALPPSGGTGAGGTLPIGGSGGVIEGGTGGQLPPGGSGGAIEAGSGGLPPAGGAGGDPPVISSGTCCPSGDCLCHGPDPFALTSSNGPFNTTTFTIPAGTVHYPTDAEPPFAAVALCGGFLNTGPEMADWGSFYASHGIVTVITSTLGSDFPDVRATKLLAAIDQLKAENTNPSSPLSGKLAGRYGTSGYSMGGGGTTIASSTDPSLRTSVGLAAWSPVGAGVQVPTLLLCGSSDGTAPCSMSQGSYASIPESTPKMMVTISGATHFSWFGPTGAGGGVSGETALAFQKVFLEGDERWRPLLLQSSGTVVSNIQ